MKQATIKLVFDRKKVADTRHKGLLQIEVGYGGRRKWISTGIKLYGDQWKERQWVVNSVDRFELNERLREKVRELEEWIRRHEPFSWEAFERYVERAERASSEDVADYVERKIAERNDLRDSTKRAQRKVATLLRDFGGIVGFKDLTGEHVLAFDNYLHGRKVKRLDAEGVAHYTAMRQQSVMGVHKIFKVYVACALREGLIERNPYDGLRFKRGESEPDRFLTEGELKCLEDAHYSLGSVARARDLFVFQCYTGISYADLADFDASRLMAEGGEQVYRAKRKKTGEVFTFVLLDKARAVLEKYGEKLPVPALAVYNRALKRAALEAGIEKPIASHWARRTAAVLLASHGVRYEVIAKVLGHASVVTTERFYADLTTDSVVAAMKDAGL